MKAARILGVTFLVAAGSSLVGAASTYTNPVIDEIGPADPTVVRVDETYYMYCTGDNTSYHVYTSPDLVHWTKGRKVFEPGPRNVWAPDVFRDPGDGRFYLYYTVNKRIGVAVADRPDGTFEDHATFFENAIDAHLFRDADGRYYLYYVQLPGFRIHVQRMKSPLEREGEPIEILRPTEPWEKISGAVTEGPWMLVHDGTYYLLYSGTGANSLNYAIGYATADSPTGPFTKHPGNPIVQRNEVAFGPGHGCVVADDAGQLWSVYHQQKDDTEAWNRFVCIDPLWFDEQGVLHGKATRGTAEPAPVIHTGTKLAAEYTRDKGIEDDPHVLAFTDFESDAWREQWSGGNRDTVSVVENDVEHGFVPLQGKALRIRVEEGAHMGASLQFDFKDKVGREPEEIYFRYYLRLGSDWDPERGGKLPGIGGTYGRAGWGGRPSNGRNGWSARGQFKGRTGGKTPIGFYCYHADMEGRYGSAWIWEKDGLGYLENDRWYCIEQYARMNTPGKNDGMLRGWVDGKLAFQKTEVRMRDVRDLKIECIWINIYHGGKWTATSDDHLYIDNVAVARRYIGSMELPHKK